MKRHDQANRSAAGYAMAALLVALAVMAVLMSVAMPVWRQAVQREKEEELVFRGKQYARAIGLFQRKFASTYPPSVDVLVQQKFLRKKYKDPMGADGEFQALYQFGGAGPGQVGPAGGRAGQPGAGPVTGVSSGATGGGALGGVGGARGGIIGVASKNTALSIRLYNGRNHYNEWLFTYAPPAGRPGGPGTGRPGQPGMGQPEMPGRGGRGGQGGPGGRGMGPGGGRGMGPGGGRGQNPQDPGGPPTRPLQPGQPGPLIPGGIGPAA